MSREENFMIPEVQMQFKPKLERHHLATEMNETQRGEIAAEITRNLKPWAREAVLYNART